MGHSAAPTCVETTKKNPSGTPFVVPWLPDRPQARSPAPPPPFATTGKPTERPSPLLAVGDRPQSPAPTRRDHTTKIPQCGLLKHPGDTCGTGDLVRPPASGSRIRDGRRRHVHVARGRSRELHDRASTRRIVPGSRPAADISRRATRRFRGPEKAESRPIYPPGAGPFAQGSAPFYGGAHRQEHGGPLVVEIFAGTRSLQRRSPGLVKTGPACRQPVGSSPRRPRVQRKLAKLRRSGAPRRADFTPSPITAQHQEGRGLSVAHVPTGAERGILARHGRPTGGRHP